METTQLTYEMTFEEGAGEVLIDTDHPLATVFRRAVQTGKATGEWFYLLARAARNGPKKLLGTAARTEAGRMLFFPGQPNQVQSTHPDSRLNGRVIDHATLAIHASSGRFEQHIAVTTGPGKTRGARQRGIVHDGILHPWLSLLLPDLDGYPTLPPAFRFEFAAPSSDVRRRCGALQGRGSVSEMRFPEPREDPSYYQVDVWAGMGRNWQKRYANALQWPNLPGFVDGHRSEPVERKARWIPLGDDGGVIVVLTRPSGVPLKTGLMHATIEPTHQRRVPKSAVR